MQQPDNNNTDKAISPWIRQRGKGLTEWNGWSNPLSIIGVILLSALLIFMVISVPMSLVWQTTFAMGLFFTALWLRQHSSRLVSLMLIMMSLVVSSRYLYWRMTDTLGLDDTVVSSVDLIATFVLLFAEIYAVFILFLGHFQTAWPLDRKPVPMPKDVSSWPSIDIMIPTYDEPLKVVRATVLGALSMDWPKDKMHVYLLDDGRRDEFREFAAEAGIGYVVRDNNDHAKAGNINNALKQAKSELVAIFDSDHIPVRSFLQMTVGWFMRDEKLGMLQTPHHFYSPDPFERNLGIFRKVPNEGELFYGLVQDGNDFWNACFFCGSCAVLRREMLDEVGGVAVETVTEDAHTALKMNAKGYNTAYINLPQASGLATESLSAHVGQRIRWARGMAQIFRVDNPLLKRGLSLGQRLCYFNAMMHFFYGLPRLIFLSAPLAYMFFEAHIIQASALLIAAYALPHLAHANLVNSRLQGPHRHSFWAEVYESTLASYIVLPTTLALINPKLGTFNVTAKGGLVNKEFFDTNIAKPYLILMGLNLLGLIIGIIRLFWWNTHELDTVLLNIAWTIYNLITLGAATAVCWEARQQRENVRVVIGLEAQVELPTGQKVSCTTADISEGGVAMVNLPETAVAMEGQTVAVILNNGRRDYSFPAVVVGNDSGRMRLRFDDLNLQQHQQLIQCTHSRADAWVDWGSKREDDRLLKAMKEVSGHGVQGLVKLAKAAVKNGSRRMKTSIQMSRQTNLPLIFLALMIGVGMPWHRSDAAPEAGVPTADSPPNLISEAAADPAISDLVESEFTLEQLGAGRPLQLRGIDGRAHLPLDIRADQVVVGAELYLRYAYSPALLEDLSHINIFVNEELAATLPVPRERSANSERTVPLDPRLFTAYNRITVQLIGHYTRDCEDPVHTSLWAVISNKSVLRLKVKQLSLKADLSDLPAPFFDSRDNKGLELPFVFPGKPSPEMARSAGAVASWFGAMAAYRGAHFPVSYGPVPEDNAVMFATAGNVPRGVRVGSISGPTIAIVDHPSSAYNKLLLIAGRDAAELDMAVRALILNTKILGGRRANVSAVSELPERKPYDAPRWLPSDRKVNFGELVSNRFQLEVEGYQPQQLSMDIRLAPDLFTWRSKGVPLNLKYRYTTAAAGRRSTLNVNINDEFVEAVPLALLSGEDTASTRLQLPFLRDEELESEEEVVIPAWKIGGRNQLQFYFYFERPKKGACEDVIVKNVRAAIDEDSTIDLTSFPHYAPMPDLAKFVTSGYPFTRMADLSETAVVMPTTWDAASMETFLSVMGRMGDATGWPTFRVKLINAGDVEAHAEHDFLVLGTLDNQPLLQQWSEYMPLAPAGAGVKMKQPSTLDEWVGRWEGRDLERATAHASDVIVQAGPEIAAIMGFQSPLASNRSVVVMSAANRERLVTVAKALQEPALSNEIQGDLALLNGNVMSNYKVGPTYDSGNLPWWTNLRWFLSSQPILLLIMVGIVIVLLAALLYRVFRGKAVERGGSEHS